MTADRAALLRAVHQRWDRPLVFDDPVAARLLDGTARTAVLTVQDTAGNVTVTAVT